jgi:hypothetical protein
VFRSCHEEVWDVYGSAARLRPLTGNNLVSVRDFMDFSTTGPFESLLHDITTTLQRLVQEFRAEHDPEKYLIVHNDLASVIEEFIQIFVLSFCQPGIQGVPAPDIAVLASAAVLYAQHHNQDSLIECQGPEEGGAVNIAELGPRVLSPVLPPVSD